VGVHRGNVSRDPSVAGWNAELGKPAATPSFYATGPFGCRPPPDPVAADASVGYAAGPFRPREGTTSMPAARPRIVILDGLTTNPGDVSWAELESLGDLVVHDRTEPGDIVPRASGADILLTNKTEIGRETLAALPGVKCIGVLATGYNVVDVTAAGERGIPVCNVPEYSTPNVVQATFALLLELTNRTGHHAETVRAGRWSACPDFCYWDGDLVELAGLTLGIVGCGRIGRAVATVGRAFGMNVLAHRRRGPAAGDTAAPGEPTLVDLDRLFRESDVVSLHCPLTPETRGLVDAARIATMKPTAFLINTARGALVNEADLAAALDAGRLAGAGLDVLSVEPPPADNPLLEARNCIITPHIAWATRNARERLIAITAANVRAFLGGTPQNVVNGVGPTG
jgi:glycerate dehydrogenase